MPVKDVKDLCRWLRVPDRGGVVKFEGSTMGALEVGHESTATALADLISKLFAESDAVAHGVQIGDPLPPSGTKGNFTLYLIVASNLLTLKVQGGMNTRGTGTVSKTLEIWPLARLDEVRILVPAEPAEEPPKVSFQFRDRPEAVEIKPGDIRLGDATAQQKADFVARFAAAAIRLRG
jgi:hypothetical protein